MELCRDGNHSFKVIDRVENDPLSESVTRWCTVCGSLVTDLEFDGRVRPGGVLPIQHSELYIKTLKGIS